MGLLDGKTALITGAGRGQGRAHALALASEGARIVAVDIGEGVESVPYALATEQDLARTAEEVETAGGSIVTVLADVRDQASLAAAVDAGLARFGAIDICVANAGVFSVAPIWEMSEQQWTQMIDINLSGVWRTAKAVLPHMIERRGGSLVLIASVNALEPGSGTGHYTSAKHGILGLCRSIAVEVAPYGVRCNAVCPGAVDTGMLNWPEMYNWLSGKESGGTHLDLRKAGARYHALAPADVMAPGDISGAVLFLSSDLARSVTGIALPVDRGHLLLPKTNENSASYADGLA
ncbi:mycofactocin-coupled SDR family oxidoreductase [Amycolatopsis pithecellobii]|uniref:Mycofactocin-coupled SDR family oxidoreductase n=1 Tax=Amycolatopsis pithecellobii TaxID=664692 RepID=A0A6N7Z2C0_9PSEU|nr:mycofactocin-coupled SDR family oxidoreductase [Amycolatopsis pithecellobii]MTD54020.1 mycofactocin-coupled SDR family oxidoreductase [Amycolatopsis pithecellobii]